MRFPTIRPVIMDMIV